MPPKKEEILPFLLQTGGGLRDRAGYEEAIQTYQSALSFALVGEWREISATLVEMSRTYCLIGWAERAAAHADAAWVIVSERDDPYFDGLVMTARGRIGLLEQAWERARAELLEAYAAYTGIEHSAEAAEARLLAAEAALGAGDHAAALEDLDLVSAALAENGREQLSHIGSLVRGSILTRTGALKEAGVHLGRARKFFNERALPEYAWQADHRTGRLYLAQNNHREAAKYFIAAMEAIKTIWSDLPARYKDRYIKDPGRRAVQEDLKAAAAVVE